MLTKNKDGGTSHYLKVLEVDGYITASLCHRKVHLQFTLIFLLFF